VWEAYNNERIDDPMSHIKDMHNDFLLEQLYIKRYPSSIRGKGTPLDLLKLINAFEKSKVWKEYSQYVKTVNDTAALIFNIHKHGDWIIHNYPDPLNEKGLTVRIIVRSINSDMQDITIQPLKEYMKGRV